MEAGGRGKQQETADLQMTMERLAPALRKLPPGTQVSFIADGGELYLYNVNKAFDLIKGRKPSTVVNVAERAKLIQARSSDPPPEDKALIDPDHAATVDLSYPVLLLEGVDELDGSEGRVIDGWHRIYKAAQLGIAELPAIVIMSDEAALVRIDSQASEEREEIGNPP